MTDNVSTKLQTRTGLTLLVRQAGPDDAPILVELFHNVSLEELRFRFLTGLSQVGADQIKAMTQPDYSTIESYIAFDPDGTAVATGSSPVIRWASAAKSQFPFTRAIIIKALGGPCSPFWRSARPRVA